jgi:hypothetical protein
MARREGSKYLQMAPGRREESTSSVSVNRSEDVSVSYPPSDPACCQSSKTLRTGEADARIRTADPFITSEVLYQLSYVGGRANCSRFRIAL